MKAIELYNEFTDQIEQMLLSVIRKSKVKSEHYDTNVIKINIELYTEIGVLNNRLMLLDSDGDQYELHCIGLDDLCDIIDEYN